MKFKIVKSNNAVTTYLVTSKESLKALKHLKTYRHTDKEGKELFTLGYGEPQIKSYSIQTNSEEVLVSTTQFAPGAEASVEAFVKEKTMELGGIQPKAIEAEKAMLKYYNKVEEASTAIEVVTVGGEENA